MNQWFKISILSLAALVSACTAAGRELWKPAPGHEGKPVIFWAHYMPMVSYGFLHCSNHAGGNIDVFPFSTQDGSGEDNLYNAMKQALASGINGFQFLTSVPKEAYSAAARIKKDTGQTFYIALEGCGMGADPKKAAAKMVAFAKEAEKSPFVYKVDGKPVIFFYSQGKWSGNGGTHVSTGVPAVRELMKKQGVEVMLIPTVSSQVKVLLDRMDIMYRTFPPFVKGKYGSGKWLKETNWDGITALNGGANARQEQVEAVKEILKKSQKPFLLVPSIRTMYDSSNRWWQAIHCRGLGVRVIRRDLKLWLEAGFRLFTFSTWNDMMETMLMPSSRNPWGLNDLIKYYHALAAIGHSPFKKPHFVISYEPEVLLGDQGFFQFLVLPERDCMSADYSINVTMKNIDGKKLLSFGNLAQVDNEINDALAETRYDTTGIKDKYMLMVPHITIRQIDKTSGESRVLFSNLRLAPIRIRYNKLHFYTPYTISLNHVDPQSKLALQWAGKSNPVIDGKVGYIEKIKLDVASDSSFRRVNLNESSLSVGAFRSDDLPGKQSAFFIRMTTSRKIRCVLNVDKGIVDSVYHAHWNFKKALKAVRKNKAYFDISYDHALPTVARVFADSKSGITLRLAGMNEPVVNSTIEELAQKPLCTSVTIDNKKIDVDVRLTTDATDANIDYPLPAQGVYERSLPLQKGLGALRTFHVWALGKNDTISYSNPVALVLKGNNGTRKVNYINTGGVFDDFVNDSSSAAANPFSVADIENAEIPVWMIPYILIDFNEGCGAQVNHNGTAMQLGRGWLTGNCKWIEKGWDGASLQINDGALNLRSKTMPHGSMTLSMRVKFAEPEQERILFEDGDNWQMNLSGPLSLRMDGQGRVIAHRVCSGKDAFVKSEIPLKKGWNHIVVTYDLNRLSLYVNGKLSASKDNVKPSYQRTHSTPKLGVSKLHKSKGGRKLMFAGQIDQIEIIGTALNADEVNQIFTNGKWQK